MNMKLSDPRNVDYDALLVFMFQCFLYPRGYRSTTAQLFQLIGTNAILPRFRTKTILNCHVTKSYDPENKGHQKQCLIQLHMN